MSQMFDYMHADWLRLTHRRDTSRAVQLATAARLYRVCRGTGSDEDEAETTLAELEGLRYVPGFDEFCQANRLQVYEEVVR